MASALVGQHQITMFTTPINGQTPIDANTVRGNDNTIKTAYNAHDSDVTIHFQSSTLAARPAASTDGQKWMTSDGLRLYYGNGATWNEAAYLPTAGGAVTGNVVLTGLLTVNAGTLVDGVAIYATSVTATLPSGTANDQYANYWLVTSAGSGTGVQYAGRFDLAAGYTGGKATFALRGVNTAEGLGSSLTNANTAIEGVSHGSGITATGSYRVGVVGLARWGAAWNVGVAGAAGNSDGISVRLGQNSAGVWGQGFTDASGFQIGVYATLGPAEPPVQLRAALVADNMTATDPIALFRANSVTAVAISSVGNLSIASSVTSVAGSGTDIVFGATTQTTIGANGAASALPANPLGYLVFFKGATKCALPYYNAG